MAAVGNGRLTTPQIIALARSYTVPEMKLVALGFLDIKYVDFENVSFGKENAVLINTEVIQFWANKTVGDDQVVVRTTHAK